MSSKLAQTVIAGAIAASALPALAEINVALVGDSITRGQWWLYDTYPEQLEAMLNGTYGAGEYNIGRYESDPRGPGFGHSGATLRNDGDLPYTEQAAYTASLAFQPDLVVIMLGTNDSKDGINWNNPTLDGGMTSLEIFLADYQALISSYAALDSAPDIVVMSPIPISTVVSSPADQSADIIENEIAPAIRDIVANFAEVDAFLDLNLLFPEDNAAFYPSNDMIHPNSAGNAFIAQQVFDLFDLEADLNYDHYVGVEDLDIVLANWGEAVTAGDRSMGDANGDGLVDDLDLAMIHAAWGQVALGADAPSYTPEPGTGLALVAGLGALARRRRVG
ncbi:MAG: GDSL-type esterase/lipase family protein [Phycisphaerales bacterium JB063]